MPTFKTLLLREWMQHQRGWWLLGLVPLALMVPALIFGQVHLDGSEQPPGLMLVAMLFYVQAVLALSALAVLFQAPGLARRDQQDRSIEFWVSLPIGHGAAVGATLLAQLVLFPLMALGLALLGSMVLAPLFVLRGFGGGALLAMPWLSLVPPLLAGSVRLALGVVLAVLWISPLLLLTMAASAWLKRWGVPVVAAVVGFGTLVASQAYDIQWPVQVLDTLITHAGQALIPGIEHGDTSADLLLSGQFGALTHWLWSDAAHQLQQLLSPAFAGALLFSALCFGLLVWRRSRA